MSKNTCTNCPVQDGYKPAEAVHQIAEPVEPFYQWWSNGGHKTVSAAADSRGWQGAAEAGYNAARAARSAISAPQAQDVQRDRWLEIGKAIERACVDLLVGAEIIVALEKDAGTVTLTDAEGDEQENFPTDGGLAGVVNAAIDAAIAASAAKGV